MQAKLALPGEASLLSLSPGHIVAVRSARSCARNSGLGRRRRNDRSACSGGVEGGGGVKTPATLAVVVGAEQWSEE